MASAGRRAGDEKIPAADGHGFNSGRFFGGSGIVAR
jgi:hypothetical protein